MAAWAFAVWGAFFGSIALLLRKTWAVWLFGLSLAGSLVSTEYTPGMSEGMEMMGVGGAIFSAFIILVPILLILYARAQARKGVLG